MVKKKNTKRILLDLSTSCLNTLKNTGLGMNLSRKKYIQVLLEETAERQNKSQLKLFKEKK